jgi:hypothetical protein
VTEKDVSRYLELVSRRLFITLHSGIEWQSEYAIELNAIDQELTRLRSLVDAEHARKGAIAWER